MQIMGILNVTPDSFSDGGKYGSVEQAVKCALEMVEEGADVIDVGGESTRPGYQRISDEEEIARVVPVIRAIREKSDVTISIDTYKYDVAKAAIEAGADVLNSIWGFVKDERLAELVAETGVSVVLMHNREEPFAADVSKTGASDGMNSDEETAFMQAVVDELDRSLTIAEKYGIPKDKIWLDPGVGFGKTYEQNLAVIRHVDQLVAMGYPVLMAASRKSVIGIALDLPVDQREEGTLTITVYAALKGCQMVRVHDVAENKRALTMLEKVMSQQS
ncbi:MAG: dihydropteroate synthase [Eubacterium sp.]|nr:dihydropteroate synthase [Eubacterium sp.]